MSSTYATYKGKRSTSKFDSNLSSAAPSPAQSPAPSLPTTPNRSGSPKIIAGLSSSSRKTATTQGPTQSISRQPFARSNLQLPGIRRDRTEQFAIFRQRKSEPKLLEESRLTRRMEKLIALHFPPPNSTNRTQSGFDFRNFGEISDTIKGKTAKELWKSLSSTSVLYEKEQSIVKWQDDKDVTHCPICMASFGIKTRKHHCRLCGQVVCFLPPSSRNEIIIAQAAAQSNSSFQAKPYRVERCSTFFSVEYTTSPFSSEEKVPLAYIVEIDNYDQDVFSPSNTPKEKETHKVRLCRTCMKTVLRQQEANMPQVVPLWLKLYGVLQELEKTTEIDLIDLQELLFQAPGQSHLKPKAIKKRLLSDLASYDALAKRIQSLPVESESQTRILQGIYYRSTLWIGEKMALLRSLANDTHPSATSTQQSDPVVQSLSSFLAKSLSKDQDEYISQLGVLLEQEALVKSYIDTATVKRQFEDVASLEMNLAEIQQSIKHLKEQAAS